MHIVRVHVLLWLAFFATVASLLLLCRKTSEATGHSAALGTAAWFVIGLAFVGLVYPLYEHGWLGAKLVEPSDQPGADAAMMFASAYLQQSFFAFGSVVVISRICKLHRITKDDQPRVLFWALVGSIFVRVAILTSGAFLARASVWTFYASGALFAWWSVRILRWEVDKEDLRTDSDSAVVQKREMPLALWLWRRGQLTDSDRTGRFWKFNERRTVLTMCGACAVAIVLEEVWFALDSAAAVVAVSKTTFIVVTSSVVAAITGRSWLSRLTTIENLEAPQLSFGALLAAIGIKLFAQSHIHVPHAVLLAVFTGLIAAAIVESFIATRRRSRQSRQP
jgi:predicted tellurium resistance membrane protein TerC